MKLWADVYTLQCKLGKWYKPEQTLDEVWSAYYDYDADQLYVCTVMDSLQIQGTMRMERYLKIGVILNGLQVQQQYQSMQLQRIE
eukprot:15337608-Ditylum_brightwellii.AAC.1